MMFEDRMQEQTREQTLNMVTTYYRTYHKKKDCEEGNRIPYASRVYDRQEMVNLADSSLEFWLISGWYTDEFEKKLVAYPGVKYYSLVSSGFFANSNAFTALTSPLLEEHQVKQGDKVITMAAGFPTTMTPMIQYGAVPVFVDVTIPRHNIDVSQLETAYSKKYKAVMITHVSEDPFDLSTVKVSYDEHSLWLVGDNCDALGGRYTIDGVERFTGVVRDIRTSSFCPPHHMTMDEEGAVYADNPFPHKIIRSLRD